jgi:hypothetical protein
MMLWWHKAGRLKKPKYQPWESWGLRCAQFLLDHDSRQTIGYNFVGSVDSISKEYFAPPHSPIVRELILTPRDGSCWS